MLTLLQIILVKVYDMRRFLGMIFPSDILYLQPYFKISTRANNLPLHYPSDCRSNSLHRVLLV